MDAGAIASTFKQGQKVRPAVQSVLTALSRMGLVSGAPGAGFVWRRAA